MSGCAQLADGVIAGDTTECSDGCWSNSTDQVAVHFQTCVACHNFFVGFEQAVHVHNASSSAEEVLKLADTRQLAFLSIFKEAKLCSQSASLGFMRG